MSTANTMQTADDDATMDEICNLLNEIDISLIWRPGHESDLHPRPMTLQRNNLAGGLWYFCQRNPRLTALYGDNPQVTVAVSCPVMKKCAALTGEASIVDHKPTLAHFKVPANETLLPGGYDAKRLVLLKIDIKLMDFWAWTKDTLVHSSTRLIVPMPPPDQIQTRDGIRSLSPS